MLIEMSIIIISLLLPLGVHDTVVNQLLSKMDGVEQLNNILIIGMTNRKDMIDEALLRPGRLEVQMEIGKENSASTSCQRNFPYLRWVCVFSRVLHLGLKLFAISARNCGRITRWLSRLLHSAPALHGAYYSRFLAHSARLECDFGVLCC